MSYWWKARSLWGRANCEDLSFCFLGSTAQVFCDQTTDNGGWTVIQRRVDGSTNFQRDWVSYKDGFGQLQREFWFGNQNIHHLTSQAFLRDSTIRFDMIRRSDLKELWAKYSRFKVSDETKKYKLHISGYSGNVIDMMASHDGKSFSTFDQDNDVDSQRHCSRTFKGGWWYFHCHTVNLNGAFDALENGHKWNSIWWSCDVNGRTPSRMMFSEIKVRRN